VQATCSIIRQSSNNSKNPYVCLVSVPTLARALLHRMQVGPGFPASAPNPLPPLHLGSDQVQE
jgi:hypothetical protein